MLNGVPVSNSRRLAPPIHRLATRQGRRSLLMVVAGLLLLASMAIGWQAAVVVMIGVACFAVAGDNFDRLVVLGLIVAWVAVIELALTRFTVFDQFRLLFDQKAAPIDLLLRMDLWGPRYVIAYPAVLIAERWDVSLDEAFGYFMAALLAVQAFVLTKTVEKAVADQRSLGRSKVGIAALFVIWVFGLGQFMNGRLVPAHLGMALVLYAQVVCCLRGRVGAVGWLLQAAGLLLSMMTSGTMMVAFFQIALMPVIMMGAGIRARRWLPLILSTLLILLAAWPLVRDGIDKNLTFWGGSGQPLITMLEHGWGEFFQGQPLLVFVVGTVGAVYAFATSRVWRRQRVLRPLLLNLPLATLCGLYGYSTLSMGLPALAILPTTAVIGVLALRRPASSQTPHAGRPLAVHV